MNALCVGVLVADEQDLRRAGLCVMLTQGLALSDLSQATSFAGLVSALEQDPSISLVAVNVRMLGFDGLRRFRSSYPAIRWVVTGPTPNREVVLEALAVGIHGYVPLDLPASEIQAAFRSIVAGQMYVPAAICEVSRIAPAMEPDVPMKHPIHLTNRQQEVLALISDGKSYKDMSHALGIAEGTVRVHVAAAYRTLGVHTRGDAVAALRKFESGQHAGEPFLPGLVGQHCRSERPMELDVKRRAIH
jgi:DNA-binding NarL/FixJ family response regulator